MRKTIATIGILVVLLVSLFGTAGAQDGTTPETPEDGAVQTEPVGSKTFTHPVVKVLSAYFDRAKDTPVVEEPETGEDIDGEELEGEEGDVEEGEEVVENESGLGPIGEQIAKLHDEGMGFGVLVKLFAMAEASQLACADPTAECTAVTAEELAASFKEGTGMGALFKEYGKPALLGVGHVKKELKKMEKEKAAAELTEGEEGEGEEAVMDAADAKDKGKDKDKAKDSKPAKPTKDKSKAPKGKP